MRSQICKKLKQHSNPCKAKVLSSFFKTGPGQYGEGDIFLGIPVPVLRKIAKEYKDISLKDTAAVLKSSIHEERLLALLILVLKYAQCQSCEDSSARIFDFYLGHTAYVNNWDLVDLTAPHIVGMFLLDKDKQPLYKLAASKNMWERRISIVATFSFIKNDWFDDTLKISRILLTDSHDLIHKAVGWMLREVGKRDLEVEELFLKRYYRDMPRVMLRYAIEKFPQNKRKIYLKGLF